MPRIGVSYQEVVSAISQLEAENIQPTLQSIRAHIGSGSFGTIHKHFRTWVESQPHITTQAKPLPDALFKAISREFDLVETSVRAAVNDELSEAIKSANQLASDVERLDEKIDQLEQDLIEAHNQRNAAVAIAQERLETISKLELESKKMADKNSELIIQLATANLKFEGLGELKDENKSLRIKLENAQIEAGELRGKLEVLLRK